MAGVGALALVGGLVAPPLVSLLLSQFDGPPNADLLVPRTTDMRWGNGVAQVWALLSVGCPHCEHWEIHELPRFLDEFVKTGHASLFIRDLPRDSQGATAAIFLSRFPRSSDGELFAIMALRQRMFSMNGFGRVMEDAEAGLLGDQGREGIGLLKDQAYVRDMEEDWARDTKNLHTRGVPSFVSPGYAPLLGDHDTASLRKAFDLGEFRG